MGADIMSSVSVLQVGSRITVVVDGKTVYDSRARRTTDCRGRWWWRIVQRFRS
jgi:hypothetical protein